MRFENTFEVVGSPADVLEKFDDLPLMASFLPGASVGQVSSDGSYPGSLVVSFGPKRLTFNGTITNRVDRNTLGGVLSGNANADVRDAKMALTLTYSLTEAVGSKLPSTTVNFVSEAQLTGVLAEFAKTGGVVVTNAILAEFARRFSAHFTGSDGCAASSSGALSSSLMLTEILKATLRKLLNLLSFSHKR